MNDPRCADGCYLQHGREHKGLDAPLSSNLQVSNMQIGSCAHLHISWLTQEVQQGVRGWWACRDCGTTFVPMKVYEAEIERLNAELREWTEIGHDATTQQSVVLMTEVGRLRAALQKYGGHKNEWQCSGGCLCGFSAALAGVTDETSRCSCPKHPQRDEPLYNSTGIVRDPKCPVHNVTGDHK